MWGCESSHTSHFQPIVSALPIPDETTSSLTGGVNSVVFVVKENRKSFSRERGYRVKDWLALSLLARPSRRLKTDDLPYEIVVVFSLPVFSGGTILSAVFRLYELQHVLAKNPPYSKRSIPRKEKDFNSIHRNESGISITILLGTSKCPQIGN